MHRKRSHCASATCQQRAKFSMPKMHCTESYTGATPTQSARESIVSMQRENVPLALHTSVHGVIDNSVTMGDTNTQRAHTHPLVGRACTKALCRWENSKWLVRCVNVKWRRIFQVVVRWWQPFRWMRLVQIVTVEVSIAEFKSGLRGKFVFFFQILIQSAPPHSHATHARSPT